MADTKQAYPGAWIPPQDKTTILVLSYDYHVTSVNGDKAELIMSFYLPEERTASGGGTSKKVKIPGTPYTIPTPKAYWSSNNDRRSWCYTTMPNNAENNAKYKDIAFDGFEYVPINKEYRVDKKSNTLIPGIGVVYGDYYLTGGVSLKDNTLFVSGHGTRHTPTYDGVTFWMTATVLIDGKVFAKEALKRSGGQEFVPEHGIPIGSTTFNLPEPVSGQKTQLLLEGSFNIDNLEGNASMPSATFTQDIDIQPKLKKSN